MKKLNISREAWEAFRAWESRTLIQTLPAFRAHFMTEAELARDMGKAFDDEMEKRLLDDMDAWEEKHREELLTLAERLGCTVYLAAYLKHLDEKLDFIAEVFKRRVMEREKPRKKTHA